MTLASPTPDDELAPITEAELRAEAQGKARTVIRALRGAGMKPPFGLDDGEAEEVWGPKLAAYDLAALLDAVNEFISSPDKDFPTVAEFVAVAEPCQRRRDAIARGNARPIPGQVCHECQGRLWVEKLGTNNVMGVLACSMCLPERYEWQMQKHNQHSDAERAMCQHELCKADRLRKTRNAS